MANRNRREARVRDLTYRYLEERVKRGEITRATANGSYTYILSTFAKTCGDRQTAMLGRRQVEQWMESRPHLARASLRSQLSIVKGFCRWMVDRGHTAKDISHGVKHPKMPRTLPRALTPEQVSAMLEAAPDVRARLIVVLMCQQGLRRAEVAGLQVGDLDWRYGTMMVRGKGGHERVLPITEESAEVLKAFLAEWPATRGPLIRSYRDPQVGVHPPTVGRIVGEVAYAAGVKVLARDGVSGHALRHTAATDMLRAGAHVRDVQQRSDLTSGTNDPEVERTRDEMGRAVVVLARVLRQP